MMAVVNITDKRQVDVGQAFIAPLLEAGLVSEGENLEGETTYWFDEENENPPKTDTELLVLLSWEQAVKEIPYSPFSDKVERRLSDKQALDLINYALSAPSWSVSYLEDICSMVRQTGRPEVVGATWDSH